MRKKYPGLCIGGPMNGKLYEANMPIIKMAKHAGANWATAVATEYTYTFAPTPVGVHFWLCDGETLESALTKLAVRYIETEAFL